MISGESRRKERGKMKPAEKQKQINKNSIFSLFERQLSYVLVKMFFFLQVKLCFSMYYIALFYFNRVVSRQGHECNWIF